MSERVGRKGFCRDLMLSKKLMDEAQYRLEKAIYEAEKHKCDSDSLNKVMGCASELAEAKKEYSNGVAYMYSYGDKN